MIFPKYFESRKRKKNVRTIPCYDMQGSFNDTVEGCSLWNWDSQTYYYVRTVFKAVPAEVRHYLTFIPKDGTFCERLRFWQEALKPELPTALYYNAMRGIYRCYKRCKRVQRAQAATQAVYAHMMREV